MSYTPDPHPPKRSLSLIATLLITGMFAVVLFSGPAQRMWTERSMRDSKGAAFSLVRIDAPTTAAAPVRLEDFRGKVVVMDFWATWCPPCRQQMPILQRIHEDEALRDKVQVLSINADEETPQRARDVQRFLDANQYSMMTVWADWPTMEAYHVESFPTLVILDGQGVVRHFLRGAHDEQTLRGLIATSLKP